MDDSPAPPDGALALLKWLVIVLTATMVAGMIALVALFYVRFTAERLPFPDTIALPDDAIPTALTRHADWLAVVTEAGEILIFDPDGQTLRRRIAID